MPLYQLYCIAAHYNEYVRLLSSRLTIPKLMPSKPIFCLGMIAFAWIETTRPVATHGRQRHIKDLVTRSATLLLDRGCVVRDIQFLGTRVLPQRMRRHKQYHTTGECVPTTSTSTHFRSGYLLLTPLHDTATGPCASTPPPPRCSSSPAA